VSDTYDDYAAGCAAEDEYWELHRAEYGHVDDEYERLSDRSQVAKSTRSRRRDPRVRRAAETLAASLRDTTVLVDFHVDNDTEGSPSCTLEYAPNYDGWDNVYAVLLEQEQKLLAALRLADRSGEALSLRDLRRHGHHEGLQALQEAKRQRRRGRQSNCRSAPASLPGHLGTGEHNALAPPVVRLGVPTSTTRRSDAIAA
jgi:hypothetical protein